MATFLALGLPVLDGSRSSCGWDTDDDAVAEGIFGPENLPHLVRDDYVHNGNDSYWLSNVDEPLSGFARIIGDEETARSIRTRIGLVMVEDRAAGDDLHTDLHPDQWTKETLKAAMFDNRQHAGELMIDELIDHCERLPGTILSTSGPVSTEGACEALAGWDVRDELDSTGALLFRRFLTNLQGMVSPVGDPTGTGLLGLPWLVPFDPDDPVHTPNTLNTADPRVTPASFVMAATWSDDPDECPVQADALVTYGQSEDSTSPYFNDQTWLTSAKSWVPMRFCEDDILADPELSVLEVTSHPDAPGDPDGPGRPDEPGRPDRPERPHRPDTPGETNRPAEGPGSPGEHDRERPAEVMTPAAALGAVPGGSASLLVLLLGTGLAIAVRRRA